jgi:hypothetical protein
MIFVCDPFQRTVLSRGAAALSRIPPSHTPSKRTPQRHPTPVVLSTPRLTRDAR